MATVVELLAKLRADSSQFTAEMQKAAKATEKVQTSAAQTSSSLNNMAGVFRKVATGAVALYVGKLGLDSVRAAQAAGVAQDRLARLLLTTGGATSEQIKILNAHAAALAASTVVTESNITTVQSQLATFDLHGSTIAQLTPAILDYVVAEKGAAASADEYRQMTNGLAQALNGQFASLTAVGFVLDAETKAKIKSGTESERAIAITEVLNSTYKDFAKSSAGNVTAQVALGKQIEKLKIAFGTALLPAVQGVQTFMSNTLLPALEKVLVAFGVFIKVLGSVASFVKKYEVAFTMLATAIITYITLTKAARLATAAFGKVMLLQKKILQAYAFFTYTATGATTGFAGAMNLLKAAFMTNPIGIIITALVAVGVGFKMAWEKSETFRKVVIGAIQVVVKSAAKAFEFLSKLPGGLGDFFDKAAVSTDKFAKSLEKYKTITKDVKGKAKDNMPDLSGLGTATGGAIVDPKVAKAAESAAAKLVEMKRDLKKAVDGYNDYLVNDFSKSFMNGADSARSAVEGALDKLESVIEAKGKMLSGGALAKLRASFDKINKGVRGQIQQYAAVAQQIADVQEKINQAQDDLNKAIEDRADSMKKFGELLRTPFGEPSDLTKALSGSSATVDSIIDMYDNLVETITQRFSGIDPTQKNSILGFLNTQTTALIKLAREREVAVNKLEDAQSKLSDLLEEQASFTKSVSGSMRNFATALIDLSNADSTSVLSVAKTATGLVISQIKESSGGVDSITKQLNDRLAMIKSFAANVKTLLASGLNKDYIRQLLEAGPEAASGTAALLATAGATQISEINSLYDQIGTASTAFGDSMSSTFYDNAVALSQGFVNGLAQEVETIQLAMDSIKNSITATLEPLMQDGTNLGTDLALGLLNGLESQRAALVATAQSIADQMVAVMASAFAQISAMSGIKAPSGVGKITKPTNPAPAPYVPTFGGTGKGQLTPQGKGQMTQNDILKILPPLNMVINTQKVSATVTPTTITTALKNSYKGRR
jgi:hypothetical protein